MTDPRTRLIEDRLREGKAQAAILAAQELCASAGATKETGLLIAKAAASVYRDLVAPPVHEFTELAESALPAEVGTLVSKALTRLIRMTDEWEKKLWEVHTERLTREIRDWVRSRHIDPAAANVARLVALVTDEQRARRVQFIGFTLGTVINNQKEARELIHKMARDPRKFHLEPQHVSAMEAAREKRHGEMIGVNLDTLEQGYSSTLTQVVVEIKNSLPDPSKMEEPDENVLRDAGDVFRSILRVPIWREEPDLLLDSTLLFVDFIPKALSSTAKAAHLEGRVYGTLGYTAKKAVLLTFQEIGKNQFFTKIYKAWAKNYMGTDAIRPIVEFMGALRTPEFQDFLNALKADRRSSEAMSQQLSSALGSIAGTEASGTLMNDLRAILSKKRVEAADMRSAEAIITALGNIVRSPRTDAPERHRIQEFLHEHVPEDLTKLATFTVLQAFTYKHEEATIQLRHWAIRVLVRGLWAPDDTTIHHKGGERQASELGFRYEIVEALVRIAAKEPYVVAKAAEPMVNRFGAAFMAIAEVFEKNRDQQFLPLLERMLTTAVMHDDARENVYQQEFFWDAATQERKPVTKEKLIAPIVHAIGTIGGDKAREILKGYQENIASHRVAAPSSEVAELLQRFLGAGVFVGHGEEGELQAPTMSEEEQRQLLKQLTKSYLLSGKETRRLKKIEALTLLAQCTPLDALDAVLDHLGDKDSMVVSAAITCISEYALPRRPKTLKDLAINGCLDRLQSKDPAVRQGAVKALKEIGPNRKDVHDRLLSFTKHADQRETREAIGMLLKTGGGAPSPSEQLAALAEAEGGVAKKPGVPDSINKIELRRQYMAARKAWVDGGKQGDPPSKPVGLDD